MTTANDLVHELTARGWFVTLAHCLDRSHRYPVCAIFDDDDGKPVDHDGHGIDVYEFGDSPTRGFRPGFQWSVNGRVYDAPTAVTTSQWADRVIESIRNG